MDIVKVNSIGEERKKFRIQVGISSNQLNNQGNWSFNLPPLQEINNSSHFNQCTIKFTKVIINPFQEGGGANPGPPSMQDNLEPCWIFNGALRGKTVPVVLMHFSIPCPQNAVMKTQSLSLNGGSGLPGDPAVLNGQPYETDGMYRLTEMIPCVWQPRQNFSGQGFLYNAPVPAVDEYSNNHMIVYQNTADDGLLCGNPFGGNITIRMSSPTDDNETKLYLSNDEPAIQDPNSIQGRLAIPATTFKDITEIYLEFYVEMIENK
tara:strand:+ start:3802 stop:4590 length:789 start_codon:yes stop_codon:yes gene_type:complete